MSELIGERVCMEAADHPHAGKVGVVIGDAPCQVCATLPIEEQCTSEDLIVRLDDGTETRVYVHEAGWA